MTGRQSRFPSCSCAKLRFLSWSYKNVIRVLDMYYKVAISKLRKCTSRTRLLQSCDFRDGVGSVLRVLDLYYKVAISELELRKCTSRIRLVLQSCDFRAGAAEVYFSYSTCTTKLRFPSWSCGGAIRVLDLYIPELELWKCSSRTRLVLQSRDFRAGAAEVYFACWTCATKI